jgi:hypothetical protein
MLPPQEFLKIGTTAEAIGVIHSLFYTSGKPGAAVAPTPGLSGAALTSYGGQIPWTNPVSGNSYLAKLQASSSVACRLNLLDRLWHNSGITATTTAAQTINSVTFPARDLNGATAGNGVMVAIEVSSATTNASAITNMTMSYTNSSGTAGKTATISSFPATAAAGTFVPFQLAAGDNGVQSIQSLTLGTSLVTGTVHLVAYRSISFLELIIANTGNSVDAITGGFVRLYDNTVPFLTYLPTAVTANTIGGMVIVTQG